MTINNQTAAAFIRRRVFPNGNRMSRILQGFVIFAYWLESIDYLHFGKGPSRMRHVGRDRNDLPGVANFSVASNRHFQSAADDAGDLLVRMLMLGQHGIFFYTGVQDTHPRCMDQFTENSRNQFFFRQVC